MQEATKIFPNNYKIRLTTAGLYEKLGLDLNAIEEYRNALIIDPKNQEAKRKLDNLLSKNKGS